MRLIRNELDREGLPLCRVVTVLEVVVVFAVFAVAETVEFMPCAKDDVIVTNGIAETFILRRLAELLLLTLVWRDGGCI